VNEKPQSQSGGCGFLLAAQPELDAGIDLGGIVEVWPKAWTPAMLDFFRKHPHKTSR
jgi:hypothetical protein